MSLELPYRITTWIWTDKESDLKFTWNDCCPYIEVSYLGDCADVVIDTLETLDPAIATWGSAFSRANELIEQYVKEKTPS